MTNRFRYFGLYKPFGMLSQFTREAGHPGLTDLGYPFPPDCYPLGRLDRDSEGLLLLTNDPSVNKRLLDPEFAHTRSYLVQVEGGIDQAACRKLSAGVSITLDGREYRTLPADAQMIPEPERLPERNPPIRFRKSVPTSWIRLRLREGKNRQVRRMTAAVGFPTLRLIRESIGELELPDWTPGNVTEWSSSEFFRKTGVK